MPSTGTSDHTESHEFTCDTPPSPAGAGVMPLLSSVAVDLSGIIFVVLAVAWAVYLIPKALKHHDEVARTRSIDRFSTAMRVLARREPVNRRDARLVVTPARAAASRRRPAPTRDAGRAPCPSPAVPPRPAIAARRKAARAAARRRRTSSTFLLLCTAVTAGAAAVGLAPWWSVAIPGGLTLRLPRALPHPGAPRVAARLRPARPSRPAPVDTEVPVARRAAQDPAEVAAGRRRHGTRRRARCRASSTTPRTPSASTSRCSRRS